MMKFSPRTLVAIAALGLPAAAFAQIVPPPMAPGAKAAAQAPGYAQMVIPAAPVSGLKPTAELPAQATSAPPVPPPAPALIDIALPDAPKVDLVDLRPVSPVAAKKLVKQAAPKKGVKAEPAEDAKPIAKPLDPFAGLVAMPVSESQLNRFVFPEPVAGVYFSEGAPLPECEKDAGPNDPCKPVFLNGKRMMLLQLRAGAKGPIQMLVHLESGRMLDMNLLPAKGPGAVVRVEGAEDGASDIRLAAAKASKASAEDSLTASEKNVALLSRFAAGDIPAGFEAVKVGEPIRFEHFDVVPAATWDNGANLKAHLYQVRAHGDNPVRINAALFRSANVRALALDRDVITKNEPAMLYLLEFVPTEAQ